MTDILLDKKQAATHLGIPVAILSRSVQAGNWSDLHSSITS